MTRASRTAGPEAAESPVPSAAYWGLFAAWAVHDVEELLTMARWSRTAVPRLRERFPRVPDTVWRRLDTDQAQVNAAIGLMAVIMAAAAADGARTRGTSAFYRTVLTGFGVHGLVHLAQSAAWRGYTPGVLTAPTVVLPYSAWALTRLRRAGLPSAPASLGLALLPVATGVVHSAARRLTRRHAAASGADMQVRRPTGR
ncbi:HXXEE domain-containing protein [Streptomyces sp. NPDC006458]|uniref:HXXEE domain-containing protein n=1 Tax=Streptomyces sp. NPDC006458 TaxID=3154302 RepID=UPI0033A5BBAE